MFGLEGASGIERQSCAANQRTRRSRGVHVRKLFFINNAKYCNLGHFLAFVRPWGGGALEPPM